MKTVSAMFAGLMVLAGLASRTSPRPRKKQSRSVRSIPIRGLPSFTEPYRKGWQLALEEINAAGGVDGKKLEVISKDDGGKPADAVTAANELVSKDGVVMLAGTFLLEYRTCRLRFRQAEEDPLPRRRAFDRRDHMVKGQSLHIPPASSQL